MGSQISEQALEFVKQNGPVLPSELARFLGKDLLIASALLSELASRKLVRITKAKIGGSPLYYVEGQEEKLERLLPAMNEKDRQTCFMLKERGVIREEEADPLTRVSLKSIPDFAVSFNHDGKTFWRWHLLSEQDALSILQGLSQKAAESEMVIKAAPSKPRITIAESIESAISGSGKAIILEDELKKKSRAHKKVLENISKSEGSEERKTLRITTSDFLERVKKFFSERGVEVLEEFPSNKKSQYDFKIRVKSDLGSFEYFCRAKDKKLINEDDLSSAYVQAQMRGLPCILLTDGQLTKKASKMLETTFKNFVVKSLS
ncbi:MAG: hypothetical protein QXJ50_01400 [Candidatus Woesearchaeota archaeon]